MIHAFDSSIQWSKAKPIPSERPVGEVAACTAEGACLVILNSQAVSRGKPQPRRRFGDGCLGKESTWMRSVPVRSGDRKRQGGLPRIGDRERASGKNHGMALPFQLKG